MAKAFEQSIITAAIPLTPDDVIYSMIMGTSDSRHEYLHPMTYKWFSEFNFRQRTVSQMCHQLWSIETAHILRDPHTLNSRWTMALRVMYSLVDCTVGWTLKHSIRARQVEFLEGLNTLELGTLGIFSRALASACRSKLGQGGLNRECLCVLEDQVSDVGFLQAMKTLLTRNSQILQYGPSLAWAGVAGSSKDQLWFASAMEQGRKDLRAFEEGQDAADTSVQSILWLMFRDKTRCNRGDEWNTAVQIIEQEFASKQTYRTLEVSGIER